MTQKTRQTQLFTGGVFVDDMDSPVVRSSAAKAMGGGPIQNVVALSQADYDAIPAPDPGTVYLVAPGDPPSGQVYNIAVLSQAEYDAISAPDDFTVYFIV